MNTSRTLRLSFPDTGAEEHINQGSTNPAYDPESRLQPNPLLDPRLPQGPPTPPFRHLVHVFRTQNTHTLKRIPFPIFVRLEYTRPRTFQSHKSKNHLASKSEHHMSFHTFVFMTPLSILKHKLRHISILKVVFLKLRLPHFRE
jgi:hypothetical protein